MSKLNRLLGLRAHFAERARTHFREAHKSTTDYDFDRATERGMKALVAMNKCTRKIEELQDESP